MPAHSCGADGGYEGDSAATTREARGGRSPCPRRTRQTSLNPGFRGRQGRWKRDEAKEVPGNERSNDRIDCVAGEQGRRRQVDDDAGDGGLTARQGAKGQGAPRGMLTPQTLDIWKAYRQKVETEFFESRGRGQVGDAARPGPIASRMTST